MNPQRQDDIDEVKESVLGLVSELSELLRIIEELADDIKEDRDMMNDRSLAWQGLDNDLDTANTIRYDLSDAIDSLDNIRKR